MKRSILMLLVMSAALIFFGCEKMDEDYPETDVNDEEMAAFKGAKAGKTFSGICTNVLTNAEVNQWYDDTDDWRTTGNSFWVQPDLSKFEGTCTLIVEARNQHEESAGKWEMTWEGSITPSENGLILEASAEGVGVAGKVKGMKATWTYTMTYVGADFPNPENPTFFYTVEGNILANGHGKHHKHKKHHKGRS